MDKGQNRALYLKARLKAMKPEYLKRINSFRTGKIQTLLSKADAKVIIFSREMKLVPQVPKIKANDSVSEKSFPNVCKKPYRPGFAFLLQHR